MITDRRLSLLSIIV